MDGSGTHAPATQASVPLQGSSSSWGAQSAALWQAQALGPALQAPAAQASPVVHGLPSSHGPAAGAWTQPVAGSQESAVQGLPSPQGTPAPTQTPPAQASSLVSASALESPVSPGPWGASPLAASEASPGGVVVPGPSSEQATRARRQPRSSGRSMGTSVAARVGRALRRPFSPVGSGGYQGPRCPPVPDGARWGAGGAFVTG